MVKYAFARLWRALPLSPRRRLMWLIQPTFTVGVSAVVLNESNDVLLLRHRFRESSSWQFPGGYLERGEDLETAIRRELREETGYDVDILDHLAAEVKHPLHIDVVVLARIARGALTVDRHEVLEAHFFPLDRMVLAQTLDVDELRRMHKMLARIQLHITTVE